MDSSELEAEVRSVELPQGLLRAVLTTAYESFLAYAFPLISVGAGAWTWRSETLGTGLAVILLFPLATIIHEAAHVVVFRAFSSTGQIRFSRLRGHLWVDRERLSPGRNMIVSAAGPMAPLLVAFTLRPLDLGLVLNMAILVLAISHALTLALPTQDGRSFRADLTALLTR